MQTIKIGKIIDRQRNTAVFKVDEHEMASVKQNTCLPTGYYKGVVRGFGELFSYEDNFDEAVENVTKFIENTFSHEFGISIQFID